MIQTSSNLSDIQIYVHLPVVQKKYFFTIFAAGVGWLRGVWPPRAKLRKVKQGQNMLISRFYSHLHSFLHPSQYEKHSDIGRASMAKEHQGEQMLEKKC